MSLRAALAERRFAVTAELAPPRGAGTEGMRRAARTLRGWVDAANVTDNQGAMVRMASWAGSVVALEEGLEPVMQLVCRDRNRMALQSDLLGAGALGIPNVLLLSGDHPRFGDHPEALPVFDIDSVQLVWTARTLRDERRLLSGKPIKEGPALLIGAVENPFAPPLRFRADRLGKKVAAGADFVQTQFVFDRPTFARWMADVRALGLHERCAVIAGVGPVRSMRALERMRTIPGIVIPDDVIRRLHATSDAAVLAASIDFCAETIAELRATEGVAGVHVMAFGLEDVVPEILRRAGLAPQPSVTGGRTDAP